MVNNTNVHYTAWETEIAKRIACAVVSYQAGVPYEELWDQYAAQGQDVGTYWLSIARQIGEEFSHRVE